jgi:hypothetical protein
MNDPRLYRGTIASGAITLAHVRVDGKVRATHRNAGTITVKLDDGAPLMIELVAATHVDGDATTTRGAWGDLCDTTDGKAFDRSLEQPFTEVDLERVAFEPGVAVVACGELAGAEFAADGGLREAPSRTAVLRADCIARGPNADKLVRGELARRRKDEELRHPRAPVRPMDPGDPATPSGFSFELMVASILFVMSIGFGLMSGMREQGVAIAGLAQAGVVFVARSGRRVPEFWRRDEQVSGTDAVWIVPATAALVIGLCMIGSRAVTMLWASLWLLGLTGVGALVVLANPFSYRALAELVRGARTARRSMGVAGAGDRPDATGRWITIEGVVRPAPGGSGDVLVRSRTEIHIGLTRRSPDRVESREVTGDRTFSIVREDGTEVRIVRDEMVWASTAGIDPDRDGGSTITVEQHIATGGRVAACGKLLGTSDGALALRSEGTRPVVVLATSPAGRPLALARRFVVDRRVNLTALVATGAGVLALAAYFCA